MKWFEWYAIYHMKGKDCPICLISTVGVPWPALECAKGILDVAWNGLS